MIFKKISYGNEVEITIKPIKDYLNFTLYQVYRVERYNKRIIGYTPLYKTCFSFNQLKEIILNKYVIKEEA